jgi:hypothetical protein
MERIAGWDDVHWSAAATAGADIVERWSIDAAATAFVDACRAGVERRARIMTG